MKVLDVDLLQDGLTRNLRRMTRLEKEMTAILKSVEELVALDEALKGEGGQAIRDFYQFCHVPFLQYFLAFKGEFHTVLEQARHALASLEPVDAGHIVEGFLDTEVEEGLTRSAKITRELTDEANAIMDTVADIVGLPHLNDSLVQESVNDAKRKRDDTLEALYMFDQTQTNQLVTIESSIQSMKEWVLNVEGLFKQGLTDVNFPSDKWLGIAGNNALALTLSAMGIATGIEAQEGVSCERPVDTSVESDRAWYQVVGDVLMGVVDGVVKAVVDIFEGLFDLLKSLFTDPIGFFGGLATAIMNPIDTFNSMWGAVETAWNRDVINGNAHSRAEFFSYAVVSVVGLKGIDKLGKAGKLGTAASKADNSLPYNAMQTNKLKAVVQSNVYTNMQQKAKQIADLLKSNFSKEAINKTIESIKNNAIITKARNTLEPTKIKEASPKIYEDVIKAPIGKTQAWMQKKKEQILDTPLPNIGPIPLGPSSNMTVRDGIEAAKDSFNKIVGDKAGDVEGTKGKSYQKGISKAEVNTAESIKNIINGRGYSVEEFAKLLHPDRVLSDSEKLLVSSIRKEIGLPRAETLMSKTIPQSDIYKYLYNQYDGVRGFTAITEHGVNLNTLIDKYNGARLDYNNTAFKTTTGVDGISQSVGLPDKFYGTIEYKATDVSKISIPDWEPKPEDYPYTGKGFTGSTDVVLPEYFQDTRKFINGDVLNIIDSDSGKIIGKFKYDMKFGWINFN